MDNAFASFEFDMRSMELNEMKREKKRRINSPLNEISNLLAHERIAGMIMPLPYMFVASLKSNETRKKSQQIHTYSTNKSDLSKAIRSCAKKNVEN